MSSVALSIALPSTGRKYRDRSAVGTLSSVGLS